MKGMGRQEHPIKPPHQPSPLHTMMGGDGLVGFSPEILGETRAYSRLSGYLIGPRFWATAFTLCPGLASYIGSV